MSKNIFNDVVRELLSGVDLKNVSKEEKDKLFEEVIDNLYYRIIFKVVTLVDRKNKDNLVNDLHAVNDDADAVIEVLKAYIPDNMTMEDVIAQVLDEYEKELAKDFT